MATKSTTKAFWSEKDCLSYFMRQRSQNGIIVRKTRYRESSLIVSALMDSGELVSFIFKGALKSRSLISPRIIPFAVLKFTFYPKPDRTIFTASDVKVVEDFGIADADFQNQKKAAKFINYASAAVRHGDKIPEIYELLTSLLRQWHAICGVNERILETGFMLKILLFSGLKPALTNCAVCGKELSEAQRLWFSPSAGGFICERCPKPADSIKTDAEKALAMEKLINTPFKKYDKLSIANPEILFDFTKKFWNYHIGEISGAKARRKNTYS